MKIAFKQSFFRLMAIVSVAAFVLGALPCAAQTFTLGELEDGQEIQIGNLRFFNFGGVKTLTSTGMDPKARMITVEPVAGDNPGLRFIANGQLTVTHSKDDSFNFALERTSFQYHVETRDNSHSIKTNSLVLVSASIPTGFGTTGITETVKKLNDLEHGSKSVFFNKIKDGTEDKQLSVALDYTSQPLAFASIEVSIPIQANRTGVLPDGSEEDGVAIIDIFEQRFSVVSLADAGPDQLVAGDTVTLDASGSKVDGTYLWEFFLKNGDLTDPLKSVESDEAIVEVEVADLKPDIYLVRLTLTDGAGVEHTDTAIIAISGPCEAEAPEPNASIHWLNLKLKQYKYCNWAFARMYGAVDLPEKLHDLPHGKVLNGRVTIVVEGALADKKPLVISTPTRMKVRNRSRYKTVLRTY